MGIIMGALAGAGKAVGEIADTNQRLWGQQELQAQQAALEQAKAIAIKRAENELADANRTKMVDTIDTGAKGIVAGRMAGNQVEDQSTWTPEQEAARNQGIVQMARDPRTRSQAAAAAGYTDEAAKLDKIADSGAFTLSPYQQRFDSEGNPIATADALGKEQARLAEIDARNKGKKETAGDKPFKMDEDDKIRLQHAHTAVEAADKGVAEAMGKLMPGDDPKTNPAVVYATNRLAQAKQTLFATQVRLNQITPDELADKILTRSKTREEAQQEMTKLAEVIGSDADAVAAKVMTDKRWDRFTEKAKPKVAEKPAQEPAKPPAQKASDPVAEVPEHEALKRQAKALDSTIAELRRDYSQATSVAGRRGVDPAVPARIKARLDAAIAKQKALEEQSETAYRRADQAIIANRGKAASDSLNSKYSE